MFVNDELKTHLETSATIRLKSAVIAEWNMNIASNISRVGNYRYRPNDLDTPQYNSIAESFSYQDEESLFYTGATDADVVIDGGFDDDESPVAFTSTKEKEKTLYSLEDCFGRFRPRSGINKLRFFENKYFHHDTISMAQRPRYYMSDKKDSFKYWSSYRTEGGVERGIANETIDGQHYIDDAAPFVVYKNKVPANRIVIKTQTNVGSVDLGPFKNSSETFDDPFFGFSNQTTPTEWKIQYLHNDNWTDAMSFVASSLRRNGDPILGPDGYLELYYGLSIPDKYYDIFNYEKEVSSESLLPGTEGLPNGTAFLVRAQENERGTIHIVLEGEYESFSAEYGWNILDEITRSVGFVTDLTSPPSLIDINNEGAVYREFQYIGGLRVVVKKMNVFDSTFDLIELSPRLAVDLSEKTTSFSLKKSASDLGVSGLPVGQLLASTGSLSLFDFDQAFFKENKNSLIKDYTSQNIQIKTYEIVVGVNGLDFFVPIKTMYSEGFPDINNKDRSATLSLRDMFLYLESSPAPQMLIQDASLSQAVSMLLDSSGFSNYVFRRNAEEPEEVIPYFYIAPDKTVAEILNDLARSTQSAMFFDEYNNFVVMSKGYMMPTLEERPTDIILSGTKNVSDTGVVKNNPTTDNLTNIVSISSQDNKIFNDGTITYSTRYIQRSYSSIKQASLLDRDKTWIYKPALLWEVSATDNVRSVNEEVGEQSAYVLGAVPINSDLSEQIPFVENHQIQNNVIDFGEGVYWMTRYNGYFYANGEILKYDAVQYNIPGLSLAELLSGSSDGDNVWISSVKEYQNYFSKVPFNGKIYPTGLVRIYSEPNYESNDGVFRLANGEVSKHGRGKFGTDIVYHSAGVSDYWQSDDNVRGLTMDSKYLFRKNQTLPETSIGAAGISNVRAKETTRTDLIKNFFATQNATEIPRIQAYPATVQSSALIMNGSFASSSSPAIDFVTYISKPLENRFRHFGTRVRIVGKIENSEIRGQNPLGSMTYFTTTDTRSDQDVTIAGGSAGLGLLVNPETNNGYYFEIAALTAANITSYESEQNVNNLFFYKVKKDSSQSSPTASAIPVPLWSGIGNILVDSGNFAGQSRMNADENTTVYDLAVEYEDRGTTRRFYLYINNVIVAIVDDADPLPAYNNIALFSRGSTKSMFENVYALTENYSQNSTFSLEAPARAAFGDEEINANKAFQKYAMSGLIQSTYLSGIGTSEPPKYNIYFEEFGTIMREAAYFNVRYDKAYPALSAKISPTFNRLKGYTVSGFRAGAYGAEFLVFNSTDTALTLDSTSGNYLRIQGVTFTQQSNNELTVDEYFERVSDMSDPQFSGDVVILPPEKFKEDYRDIKLSRLTEGRSDFSIDAPYIQSKDTADSLMLWLTQRIMKPRKSVGIEVFGMPTLQLGDIVQIDYKNENGVDEVAPEDSRFVVYYIDYDRGPDGPSMSVYLSEVV